MLKRFLACILALITLAACMVGCDGEQATTDDGTNNQTQTPTTEALYTPPESVLKTVVMKIGDIEITYETYRYLYMDCRGNYEEMGITKTVKELQAEVLEELFYQSAIYTLADRYGAGLTQKQKDEVDNAYNDLLAACVEYNSDLLVTLSLHYMTPREYKRSYGFDGYLVNNVFEHCSDEKKGILDFSEEAVQAKLDTYDRAQMIFVAFTENRGEADALKKAQGVLDKLAAGEDFVELAKSYSDSLSDEENAHEVGFYFTEDELEEAVEQAYYALEEGEYTAEPVKTSKGYYIIKRVAEDAEYFTKTLYPYYVFNDFLKETKTSLSVTYTEFFTTMFDGLDLIPERETK